MNCKAGDLAIIINAIHPENLGTIVEVLAPGEPDIDILLPYWHCRTASGRAMKFTYNRSGEVGWSDNAFMYDKDLRPIRPGDCKGEEEMVLPLKLERV